MKAQKITYWITTSLVSAAMLLSAYSYFFIPLMKEGMAHVGFPDWFRVELGTAKFFGALALILPFVPARIKEWAYVGFFINFFSAALAHIMKDDPALWWIRPFVLLLFLVTSYITYHKAIIKKIVSHNSGK